MNIEIKTDFYDILVFCHNDMDGIVGAYLVKYFYDNNLENDAWDRNVTVYDCDYDSLYSLDWFKEKTNKFIKESKNKNPDSKIKIFMIDYAIQPNEMVVKYFNWLKTLNIEFIWIDHHITAIQNLEHFNIPGKRDNSICGAMNTWKYLTKDNPPKFLKMVNDFDIWNENSEFSFEKQLMPLTYFVESLGKSLNDNTSELVNVLKLLLENDLELEKYISTFGKVIYNYVKTEFNKNLNNIYEATWKNYKCLVANSTNSGCKEFENHPSINDVDLLIRWWFDGKCYKYSLYTNKDDIDVSSLCEKYLNGGGHKKCGGGSSNKLIFK